MYISQLKTVLVAGKHVSAWLELKRVTIIALPSSAAQLSCALVAAPFCERIERYNRLAFVLYVASYAKERRQGV